MTATNVRVQMQQRRDTAANWTSVNPTLLSGELGYETDTGKFKTGNGSTVWNSLAYVPGFSISAYPLATADIADDAVTGAKLANNIDIAGTLDVTNAATFDNNVTIQGDLTVNGTTTTIDTTTLVVEDKNIEMGAVSTPTDSTADGGGITLKGATDKTLNWVNSTDCWTFNQALDLTAGTAGAPALVFNGDVNSGLFQPGADSLAIATGGTQRVTVDSSGRLLINNTTAGDNHPLQVTASNTGNAIAIIGKAADDIGELSFYENDRSTKLGELQYRQDHINFRHRVGDIRFATGGVTERMRIDSSGRVGIGTATPGKKVVVNHGTSDGLLLLGPNSGDSTLFFGDSDDDDVGRIIYDHSINAMKFRTNASEAFRVDSSGRLLVGTTSAGSNGTADDLVVANNSSASDQAGITIRGGTAGRSQIFFSDGTSGDAEYRGMLRYDHSEDSMQFRTAATERLRIDSSGNVGIGVTSPVGKTEVSGNDGFTISNATRTGTSGAQWRFIPHNGSGSATNLRIYEGVSATEVINITKTGNVGIGSLDATGPVSPLHVQTGVVTNQGKWSDCAVALDNRTNVGSYSQIGFGYTHQTTYASAYLGYISTNQASNGFGDIVFGTRSVSSDTQPTERMRILSDGTIATGGLAATPATVAAGSFVQAAANAGVFVNGYDGKFGTSSNHPVLFQVNGSEKVRIDSSGNVGVGTSAPLRQLHISSTQAEIAFTSATNGVASLLFGDGLTGTDVYRGYLQYNHASDSMLFATSATERMRILSGGAVLIGKTSDDSSVAGVEINSLGRTFITVANNPPLYINRTGGDGTLVSLNNDGSQEGTIVVSGGSVSYNGGHLSRWSQLPGGAKRSEILRGSVLSNLDEMCEWGTEDNEQLNRMKVSDVEGDKNVSGVFQAWDDDDDTYVNDFYCAMTGDFVIRIAQGTTVARGDLLMSAGDGTAKPQDDDIVRSKTIAKVTSTTVSETYSDNSYCVPCVLMAC